MYCSWNNVYIELQELSTHCDLTVIYVIMFSKDLQELEGITAKAIWVSTRVLI